VACWSAQKCSRPRKHHSHRPQVAWTHATPTRSPTFLVRTPGPTETISPTGSWPRMRGNRARKISERFVNVGVANTARVHLDENLIRTRHGLRNVLNFPWTVHRCDNGSSHEIPPRGFDVGKGGVDLILSDFCVPNPPSITSECQKTKMLGVAQCHLESPNSKSACENSLFRGPLRMQALISRGWMVGVKAQSFLYRYFSVLLAYCHLASSSHQTKLCCGPRSWSGSVALNRVARAPFGQVRRRLLGSY
jgi:hypothetical protein